MPLRAQEAARVEVEWGEVPSSEPSPPSGSWRERVQAIYRALEPLLPSVDGNPCGSCRACCRHSGVTFQTVLDVEMAALADVLSPEALARFRAYVRRVPATGASEVEDGCPLYSEATRGCSIHADRPFSCRLFGHFRLSGTVFPEACVFRGRDIEVAPSRYLEDVPLARDLRDLDRRFGAFNPPTPSTISDAPPRLPPDLLEKARTFMNPDDPLDMAVLAHVEGRLEDALALFDAALSRAPASAWGWFQLGTLLDDMKRADPAARAYRNAIELEDDNPRFWLHLAFNRLEAGEHGEARDALAATARINPDDAVACGLLGSLLWEEGRAAEALEPLKHAVGLDPGNVWFQVRLAEVLCVLGRVDEALPHMAAAEAHPDAAAHVASLRRIVIPSPLPEV